MMKTHFFKYIKKSVMLELSCGLLIFLAALLTGTAMAAYSQTLAAETTSTPPDDLIVWDGCMIEGAELVFQAHLEREPSAVSTSAADASGMAASGAAASGVRPNDSGAAAGGLESSAASAGSAGSSAASETTAIVDDPWYYVRELQPYQDDPNAGQTVMRLPKHTRDLGFRISYRGDSVSGNPTGMTAAGNQTVSSVGATQSGPTGGSTRISDSGSTQTAAAGDRLYNRFVACIWDGTRYVAVSEPVYITNPEAVAANRDPYAAPLSKKGLLVEYDLIDDAFYLGVSNVIVNIPFNSLFGSGIDFRYDGETYHFDQSVISGYDKVISAFSNRNMNVNVVLLNGWNASAPDFFYPGAKKTSNASYYMFNASTERGYRNLKAVAAFLAERYSGKNTSYGRVQNWIVGNEINNQYWNYLGPMSLSEYVREFERGFRVIYSAIRSACANDRVYFSLDHNWNRQADGRLRYNGRELLDTLADSIRAHGNIDWNLAYHPYSEPLTEPEFWDDLQTGQVNFHNSTPVINFANLSVLTEYMKRNNLLDRSGNVRHIILSEEGFTSQSATRGQVEELQAAAFAYAYYLVDSNPYIDSFILSRQVDAPSEVRSSLAFGLWTADTSSGGSVRQGMRKKIWQVFKDIDRQKNTLETTAFAKDLLGISYWSDIIPGFKWENLERSGS